MGIADFQLPIADLLVPPTNWQWHSEIGNGLHLVSL
jgi:hypothetical protein